MCGIYVMNRELRKQIKNVLNFKIFSMGEKKCVCRIKFRLDNYIEVAFFQHFIGMKLKFPAKLKFRLVGVIDSQRIIRKELTEKWNIKTTNDRSQYQFLHNFLQTVEFFIY